MDKRKVPSDKEAYKSRGMKSNQSGSVGKPEGYKMPEARELKKSKK